MSKVSNRTKIASALLGAMALAGSNVVAADQLSNVQKADSKIHAEAASSQKKINKYFDQAQDMLFEYGSVVDERESLKSYNDYVATLVADQEATMKSIQQDIDGVDALRQGVVPLMFKMVEALEQFIALDLPFNQEIRQERVARLKDMLSTAEVTLAEKYRLILDAYNIEREYGSKMSVETGQLEMDGKEILVDFINFGRVALYAQSLDQKAAWMYNAESKGWDKLEDGYLRNITKAIRQARGQGAPDMFALPIPAAEAAQ
ncbi:DUF3450 domain-containing protein [Shewanella gelidii]|uniref:DUF3450 domain-containing protein n=1 Tax=Shewanella gelidii TaxID=1642821 RepID=A0A917JL72_9GAMM|nr:DUF3450 domain-containing protein [Shewanella gelidii]MCL1097468.1 DUF3450 domain-containing protein [Shewanella gelidii]GGI75483.1 DUF3450 domain-containing protein [Shewanella gelidii]